MHFEFNHNAKMHFRQLNLTTLLIHYKIDNLLLFIIWVELKSETIILLHFQLPQQKYKLKTITLTYWLFCIRFEKILKR